MRNKCPKCGSIRIIKAREDVSICLACESLLNTIDGKSKPTLFDRITQSPEVMASYCITVKPAINGDTVYYHSTVTGGIYLTESQAIDATVSRLTEVTM